MVKSGYPLKYWFCVAFSPPTTCRGHESKSNHLRPSTMETSVTDHLRWYRYAVICSGGSSKAQYLEATWKGGGRFSLVFVDTTPGGYFPRVRKQNTRARTHTHKHTIRYNHMDKVYEQQFKRDGGRQRKRKKQRTKKRKRTRADAWPVPKVLNPRKQKKDPAKKWVYPELPSTLHLHWRYQTVNSISNETCLVNYTICEVEEIPSIT